MWWNMWQQDRGFLRVVRFSPASVFKREISGELPSKAMLFSDIGGYIWETSKQNNALFGYQGNNGQ